MRANYPEERRERKKGAPVKGRPGKDHTDLNPVRD